MLLCSAQCLILFFQTMTEQDRITLRNGLKIYPFVSADELLEYAGNQKKILVAINAEKILHATELTKGIINRNIGYSDGTGAVMAVKKLSMRNVVKIPGCELWLKIIQEFYPQGKSFYLVGATQEVIEKTINRLKKDFPQINIVGFRNGYIQTEEEKQDLIHDIAVKKPDAVFVAMGSPKQELLMEEMLAVHPAIYQGLGGSFDVYVGLAKRAPKWWLDHNLEFAYRLIKQPSRIKRQLPLLKFLFMLKTGRL